MNEFEQARKAKEVLRVNYGFNDWFRGVGIAGVPGALKLRLNVAPGSNPGLPKAFKGFPLEVVQIDIYAAR